MKTDVAAARRKKRVVGVVGLVLVILLLILYEPPFRILNLIEFLIGGLLVMLLANFIWRRIDRQANQKKRRFNLLRKRDKPAFPPLEKKGYKHVTYF